MTESEKCHDRVRTVSCQSQESDMTESEFHKRLFPFSPLPAFPLTVHTPDTCEQVEEGGGGGGEGIPSPSPPLAPSSISSPKERERKRERELGEHESIFRAEQDLNRISGLNKI